MLQLESTIERACVVIAHNYKCKLLKIQAAKGFPDRLLLTPLGTVAFMEFKRPGQTLRPLQAEVQAQLRQMNFCSVRVDSAEIFKEYLIALLAPPGNLMHTKKGA
jgi:hypothetical protein